MHRKQYNPRTFNDKKLGPDTTPRKFVVQEFENLE
jgi:hypothetical protein